MSDTPVTGQTARLQFLRQFVRLESAGGIGFTMRPFIGSLAFEEVGIGYNRADRIGIICGSLVSGIAGSLVLRHALPA